MIYKIRPFFRLQNYKNLLSWIPVIWGTYWWDFTYLLKIMEHQFKIMDNNWDKAIHIGSENTHKHIKEMRLLLKRMIVDDYQAPKWRQEKFDFRRGIFSDMNGTYYTPQEIQETMYTADLARFSFLFNKYLRTLWD